MVDYAKLSLLSTRLIKESGREITLIRNDDNSSDNNKPWLGSQNSDLIVYEEVLYGVSVDPGTFQRLGVKDLYQDFISKSTKFILISPGSLDLKKFHSVIDEGITYGITFFHLLQPGTIKLLAYLGLSR